ncbi:hypothetical protein QR680_011437 [Steinernema hermaphroditum]|uniref:Uncharacterized protein n=1 Tax=Steinernema hermaphroditum TaxID=289476 RepID=A0AA39LYZ7_9BILA|nr:hypothetical protein QR680_011437 [Steinernema hermaphroditum]
MQASRRRSSCASSADRFRRKQILMALPKSFGTISHSSFSSSRLLVILATSGLIFIFGDPGLFFDAVEAQLPPVNERSLLGIEKRSLFSRRFSSRSRWCQFLLSERLPLGASVRGLLELQSFWKSSWRRFRFQ